jgi:adenylate cyclase
VVATLAGRPISGEPTAKDVAAARDQAEFMLSDYEGVDLRAETARLKASKKPEDKTEAERTDLLMNWQRLAPAMLPGGSHEKDIEKLRAQLGGKLVFVGWTATGAEADFYPTPLDARTPGVMAHAAIANGILTGFSKVRAPWWAGLGATLVMGAGCAWLATRLSPTKSWLAATGLAGGYAALNIVGLFDRAGIVVELAAPLLGGAVAWAGATAAEAVRASRERAAIKRQFRSRVSAQLVDYLADNPQLMNMEGEERELTCVFTDFAGFTSLSEKLEGKQTVALLNRYLRAMTDVLLARGAYVNKFLGDGAMAFWGAPGIDPHHAGRCAAAMLDVIDEVEKLNAETLKAGLTRLDVRVGIATGRVVVGDCGAPPTLNDYTVIGDAVNLASRLESANKLLGTRILLSGRTLELMTPDERAALLLRPLGLVRVVGQSKPTEVYELVGRAGDGTPDERRELAEWIERTRTALELFRAGEYQKSMELWQELILFERGHAGAVLYVQRCAELIETGVRDEVLPLRSK